MPRTQFLGLSLGLLLGFAASSQASQLPSFEKCLQTVSVAVQEASAPEPLQLKTHAFLTVQEAKFQQDFAFVGNPLRDQELQNYYQSLLRLWTEKLERAQMSDLAFEEMKKTRHAGFTVFESWEFQRASLLKFLGQLRKNKSLKTVDMLSAGWWVATLATISRLPDSQWALSLGTMGLLTGSVDSWLEAKDLAFRLFSRIGRLLQPQVRSSTNAIDLFPVSIETSFVDMNFLFSRRNFVQAIPMKNVTDLDGSPSLPAPFLAHDELHAIATIDSFGSSLHTFQDLYDSVVVQQTDPLRRRILEYVYWYMWHEVPRIGFYLQEGWVSPKLFPQYQRELRGMSGNITGAYLRSEMAAHTLLFGDHVPSDLDFAAQLEVLVAAMKLPPIRLR